MSGKLRPTTHQQSASDPKGSAWVSANAGSGKTHVLVDRVIRLMLAGTEPSRILCLTFTKAAAAEMSGRLFERLSGWIAMPDEALAAELRAIGVAATGAALLQTARRLFTKALETPGGLKIQTIHAFCERLLQLFPVEAGVAPGFTVMDDREAAELLQSARNRVLRQAQRELGGDVRRALNAVAILVQANAFDGLLSEILSKRTELQSVLSGAGGMATAMARLRQAVGLAPSDDEPAIRATLRVDPADYQRLAAALACGSKNDIERGQFVTHMLNTPGCDLLALKKFYLTAEEKPRPSLAPARAPRE